MGDARLRAWVALAHAHLPQATLVALLREAGDAETLLGQAPRMGDAGRALAQAIAAIPAEASAATLKWLETPEHRLVTWEDADYPQALLAVGEAPPVLFQMGRRELMNRPAVAIVGSRRATPQGLEDAASFARALAAAGVTVVSGLAEGIDAAAHRGALDESGGSLAVVGTGLDRVYPAVNRALAHALAEKGCLLSEFVPGTAPEAWHFPRRNRLIAGLSRAVLVVEASLRSGSLITARLAGDQGREVMAVPGSIHAPLSKGCHRLIREGAKLVETAQDVLVELGLVAPGAGDRAGGKDGAVVAGGDGSKVAAAHTAGMEPGSGDAAERNDERAGSPVASPDDRKLLAAMGTAPVDFDRLVARTGLAAATIAARITALELDGRVRAMPGGLWQRRA